MENGSATRPDPEALDDVVAAIEERVAQLEEMCGRLSMVVQAMGTVALTLAPVPQGDASCGLRQVS